MTSPSAHHLAEDAREYLDQLERILSVRDRPDPEQLLRLATGVLTSARRGGAETFASVAERLEDAARSILTGSVAWSEEVRTLAAQTVRDLKLLLRALNRWGPEEERRVRMAIERWDEHDGGARDAGSVASIERFFYDDAGPHVLEDLPSAAESSPVSIEGLLLRGDAALRRALALRPEFESIARGDAVPERPLADLVDELFELLELAGTTDP